jgi:ABC-type glycerol-3-phosphate transport system permease component
MSVTSQYSLATRAGVQVQRGGRSRLTTITVTVIFIIIAFLFLIPLYWMVLSSVRPLGLIFTSGTNLLPNEATLDNYGKLFQTVPYVNWFANSIVQSVGFSITSVAICALGGFALAKYRFRGRNVIFLLILLSQMVPFYLLVIPLFVIIVRIGMVDTLTGAILPLAAHPIGIFFMRQYMLSIEDELLDAARVDGANEYRLFYSVVVPITRPAIATLLVLFALEYWNNLLWPLIVFRSPDRMPLAVGLSTLVTQYFPSYDLVMAGSTLATLPIIILFLFLRRQFMEGFGAMGTGMK